MHFLVVDTIAKMFIKFSKLHCTNFYYKPQGAFFALNIL